ncbi:MAG: efflux RND transporter permease subunit [Waddliaceae bacterium]|jgi:hydrophobic/amphiphilic exporter-1 (mainly G- bacteria), HAE1 family|nr:efflux RND transporter permease subunit [Waddliaceae bacterium]MBT3579195.1 efflux RND transporter permease subunit [Waddliaceae bacterium]MBT4444745.1 efflux RND transporter permease subunit [Waddliaceae bacterium]MBT6928895.1 efflux RND transporter permease subunit [Waddliaceae bacterium]MBT7264142.1 efflux RND transporter permease subunit [Waddliaceae bacterium]
MIKFFVKNPITTIMFVSIFIVLGIVAAYNLRIERTPKIDFPIVTVSVIYPGATPLEMETSVINKIEDAIAELSEIKNIQSQSHDNFGYVFVEFLLSSDINIKFIEVKDKVEALLNDLPTEMMKPVIEKFDPLVESVMDLVVMSDTRDERALYEFVDKKLVDQFSSIKGVANIGLYGGEERQIHVDLDPFLMQKNYVDIRDVIASVKAKNKNIPGGLLEKGDYSLNLRFIGEFEDITEISEMLIVSRDGGAVALKDIATVYDGAKKVATRARHNGENSVGMSLKKVSDGNAIEIAKEVHKKLAKLEGIIPEDITITVSSDTTTFIVEETTDTEWAIILGIILTIVILYFFTGSAITTFIASIVIPISIVSAIFLVDVSGFTINFLTLLAIATALGTLIANAIVIIENCLKHVQKGEDPVDAVIAATKEVSVAIFASTGTNLVVFAPIAFMGGIVGQFMRSFGLTVIYVTIFSLIVSFTLTPMLCGLLLRKKTTTKKKRWNPLYLFVNITDRCVQWLQKEYHIIFKVMFRYHKTVVVAVVCILLSIKIVVPYIGSDFQPSSDEDMIVVSIEMPQGSTLERTLDVVKNVEDKVSKIAEVTSYLSYVGKSGVENGEVVVNLEPSEERERSDMDVIDELVPFVAMIPDANIAIKRGMSSMHGSDVSIDIYGDDIDELLAKSAMMKEYMEDSGFFRSVTSSYKTPKNEIRFIPDQKLLLESGLRGIEIGSVIRASIYGDDTNSYKEAGEDYTINVKLDDRYLEDFDDIEQITIISRKGLSPITELGDLVRRKAMPMIQHREGQRIIQLNGDLAKSTAGYVMTVLDEEFSAMTFDEGYGYRYVGNAEMQDESSREITKAFILAVIMTYMLLSAIMNSLIYPIPIALSVATSFSGVFYALFFMGETINIASMLGMVMLVGLVVNNSILLLDYTLIKIKEGTPVIDALWYGVEQRFKPIIMTSIAIILGVVPQLWSVMLTKSSMATVMIGGMIASVIFTFLFTPIAFWYAYRVKTFFMKKSAEPKSAE